MTGRLMRLPIDPEVPSSDLGPLVLAKQQVVLEQLRERLNVLHAQAALKQQQADMLSPTTLGFRRKPSGELSMTPQEDVLKCPPLDQRGEL
ncbi:hypothetical protein SKAU_G00060750 [Synaphobranchus kaupii]|uniref:Uncharacterized protein n=1 Tax=Synaphobranchus kaupii TaxID=118154 RepID=A0A9Q1JAQ5_SYNKA|nr:hypothetical protein SKAU_G00060750 [Synaphobranchus kaupii]